MEPTDQLLDPHMQAFLSLPSSQGLAVFGYGCKGERPSLEPHELEGVERRYVGISCNGGEAEIGARRALGGGQEAGEGERVGCLPPLPVCLSHILSLEPDAVEPKRGHWGWGPRSKNLKRHSHQTSSKGRSHRDR